MKPPCEVHFWSRENGQITCLTCGKTRWSVIDPITAQLQFTLPLASRAPVTFAA